MNSDPLPEPIFITDYTALVRLSRLLSHEPIVSVDTESNSLYAYQEQVCLIQFSTPTQDYLVDPLALEYLSALSSLFCNPNIEKVFHAAEYDLICLKRDFDFDFINVFDTMVAARILGREAVGLGSILATEFDVKINKRFQRANWGQRPLPPDMLAYAQLDTHYLIPLRNRLQMELNNHSLLPLAKEDFNRLATTDGRIPDTKPGDCWRINGAYDLSPQNAAVLAELCSYRDQVARKIDRPLFKVISDKTLLAIAQECPNTPEELKQIPGMSHYQMRKHSKSILLSIAKGLHADPVYPPRPPRPNEKFLDRLDILRNWRKKTAKNMGVKSDVVLPRDLMYEVAERGPTKPEDMAEILQDVPWRLEHFGGEILNTLADN